MFDHPAIPLLAVGAYEGARMLFGPSAADVAADPMEWVSTLGPFSIAITLSYFLLRRSDSREATAEHTHLEREQQLRDDLAAARQQLTAARTLIAHLRDTQPDPEDIQ